ncbi:MAG: hypothetical protein GX093_03420, partial [Xanthomonadaceae bacterium]|nr:hypothetical protein [Xanthomonadaceae bacterium]
DHLQRYDWRKPVFWSRSYCIITVGGAPLSVLKQYIEQQESPELWRCAPCAASPPPKLLRSYRRSTAAQFGRLLRGATQGGRPARRG